MTKKNQSKDPKKASAGTSFGLKPLADRVIVKPLKEGGLGKTASGLYLPETEKDSGVKRGEVVAVGPGKLEDGTLHPVSVSIGDKVLYQWGEKVTVGNEEYVVVREGEIVAKER